VLVPVVQQMNPRKMAEVLAAMSPASAEKLTVALAGQGKDAASAVAGALPAGELAGIQPATAPRR
jgi:flagellar motility protein MotE (MotC chaperone)